MYTGTLIDELMTAVERTEEISSERERGRDWHIGTPCPRPNWRSSTAPWLGWHRWRQPQR